MQPGWLESDRIGRLTRAEYDRMTDVFPPDERLELIRGILVRGMRSSPDHAETVDLLNEILSLQVADRFRVRCGGAFGASHDSETLPDLSVLPIRSYRREHPTRALLIVEVADETLVFDRSVKLDLYAEVGVPEYWVVNLRDRVVEVHCDPDKGRYRTRQIVGRGKTLRIRAVPGVRIPVAAIFV